MAYAEMDVKMHFGTPVRQARLEAMAVTIADCTMATGDTIRKQSSTHCAIATLLDGRKAHGYPAAAV